MKAIALALSLMTATPAFADTVTITTSGGLSHTGTISADDMARVIAAAKGLKMGGVGATDQQAFDAMAAQMLDLMRTRALIYERGQTGSEPAALSIQ